MTQIKDIAITRTEAGNNDYLLMQDATTGQTYKITKADLLAGLVSEDIPSNTKFLLHFDGANNSTNFVDSSESNITVSATGTPIISTLQSKFNGSSAYFNGSSYLSGTLPSGVFSNPFTIEMFTRFSALSGDRDLLGNSGFDLLLEWDGAQSKLRFKYGSTNLYISYGFAVDTWYYLAFVFAETDTDGVYSIKIYINGVEAGSATCSLISTNSAITIGSAVSGRNFYGYLDDLRVSDTNLTINSVPTSPLT